MILQRRISRGVRVFMNAHLDFVTPVISVEPLENFYLLKRLSLYGGKHFYMSSKSQSSSTANRVSKVAHNDAQGILFDYLHCTRNLQYNDAEHISKNSPIFLQTLLSKVDNDKDISQSLTKYLRYHPINEFEPFFESLGLAPSEFTSLLPRGLMFLGDEEILLHNYHVLCNYGISHDKIGQMYQEANEIFRFDHGVLAAKLRAYEDEMHLSKPTIIASVTCCPTLLTGVVNHDFVQFLKKLDSFGALSCKWIRGYLSDGNTYSWNKMVVMMGFLEEMGFKKLEIGRLFDKHPGFLFEDSGKKFYKLVALLLKIGLSAEIILSLFLRHSLLLAGNFTENLLGALHFLSEIKMETEDIAMIIRSHTHVLGCCSLKKQPRTVLSQLKISPQKLCEIIKEDPQKLIAFAAKNCDTGGPQHLREKTTFLLRIGYVENTEDFVKALKEFRGKGDQLQERFDYLVNAGLDHHDVCKMIKSAPFVLEQTKDVIEMKIKLLADHLGKPLHYLVAHPKYLSYDIERIKVRFSMYTWLREEGVITKQKSFYWILWPSDARFVKLYVNLHSEGPAMWDRLKEQSSSLVEVRCSHS
ncbi:hypothetical protein MKX01_001565 [Papaver californicum]|nr:hypothetical protein MKX01_001565 [Papaver californicum]